MNIVNLHDVELREYLHESLCLYDEVNEEHKQRLCDDYLFFVIIFQKIMIRFLERLLQFNEREMYDFILLFWLKKIEQKLLRLVTLVDESTIKIDYLLMQLLILKNKKNL